MDGKKPLFSADAAEEYFSTLLTYYRNTGNDIFKRDNEGRHVPDQIYSAEYQKYLGMQIAMREVLEYFAKFELGDTALRQQETVENRNEPLTLEELRKMDNQPVWIEDVGEDKWHGSGWAIVDREYCLVRKASNGNPAFFERYGKEWIAYRQQPAENFGQKCFPDQDERKENEHV